MNAFTCVAITIALAQGLSGRPPRHSAPLGDYVTLSLAADRDTYYVGETMLLTITAENTSDVPVTAVLRVHPVCSRAEIYYRRDGGEFSHLAGLSRHGCQGRGPRVVAPGEKVRAEAALSVRDHVGPMRFLFEQPGTYEFKMHYLDTTPLDPNANLESNVLAVHVVEPPASEEDAFRDYTPDLANVAQLSIGSTELTPEVVRAAAEFIERHYDSRYAPLVKDGLRRWLGHRVRHGWATEEEVGIYETLFYDTSIPSLIVYATPSALWPPNHKLVPVTVSVDVSDDKDPEPEVLLESITCDDGCDANVDVWNALFGMDDREFELRAERSGPGHGRTYTITYSATDESGNKAEATTTVVVPHDQGKKKGQK